MRRTRSSSDIGPTVQLSHTHRHSFSRAGSNRKVLGVRSTGRFSRSSTILATSLALGNNSKFSELVRGKSARSAKKKRGREGHTDGPLSLPFLGFVLLFALVLTQPPKIQHTCSLIGVFHLPTLPACKEARAPLLQRQMSGFLVKL